jgi:hypothetical protein
MNMKYGRESHREVTHLSSEFCNKLRNADYLYNSLAAGSKNRLNQYRTNLSVTRGKYDVNFDSQVHDLLSKYVWDKSKFTSECAYLKSLKDDEGYSFSRNLKIYSTIEDAMKRFAMTDYTSFRWNQNYQQSLKAMIKKFSSLHLKPLSYSDDDDIAENLPKLDTHSGYYWILSGKKKKGDNMEGLYERFQNEVDKALETGSFNKPILLGFRTQASGEYEDDGSRTGKCKHKLRVVSMVDLIVIVAELMFAKPIQKHLSSETFYAGGKDEHKISELITNWRVRFNRFMSIDYTAFDQSISSWLIEDAFAVLKSAFDLDEKEERLFDIIINDFIHKDFILNEGVLHSDRGVPSGSMFTQIIDTIVNVIVVMTYFSMLGAEAEMIAMGDDNAIFTSSSEHIGELASYVRKNFGLEIKTEDKSNEGSTKEDDVKFLSRYWRFDGQWRSANQLLSRLLYPERFRNYTKEIGPEHVIFAFILTYYRGMLDLMDISHFMRDYPISQRYVLEQVDSRYLPGSLAYIREYTDYVAA